MLLQRQLYNNRAGLVCYRMTLQHENITRGILEPRLASVWVIGKSRKYRESDNEKKEEETQNFIVE